ncbi:MAG: hypothetical protein ACOY9D_07185 [Pseudomonadota bacterium]
MNLHVLQLNDGLTTMFISGRQHFREASYGFLSGSPCPRQMAGDNHHDMIKYVSIR